MRKSAFAIAAVLAFLAPGAVFADGQLSAQLRFPPVELEAAPDGAPIGSVTIVASANPVAQYAAHWLKGEIKLLFGKEAAVARVAPDPLAGDVVFLCHTPSAGAVKRFAPELAGKLAGPESFAIKLLRRDGARVVVVCGADGPGALYGAQLLADIMRVMGGALPASLEAADHPEMRVRGKAGGVHQYDETQLARLDWFARWRLNGVYYEVMGDKGQKDIPDYIARLAVECDRRGIILYGAVSQHRTGNYLKASLCPSNPAHTAYIDRLYEGLCRNGVQGLLLNCDDIPPEDTRHAKLCPKCSKRFKDLADIQIFWLDRMVKTGRKSGIKNYLVGPTPYLADLSSHVPGGFDTLGYFKKLGAFCAANNISIYHCAAREKTIGPVLNAGVTRYAWWYNGVWPLRNIVGESCKRLPGGYYGFSRLDWGWEMVEWTAGAGLRARSDALDTLRGLPKLTREAWLCGSDPAQWGMYLWRPSRADPGRIFRRSVEARLGPEAFGPYMQWQEPVQRWAMRCNAGKVEPGPPSENPDSMAKALERDARQAATAAQRLKAMTGPIVQQGNRGGQRRDDVLKMMAAEAKKLSDLANRLRRGGVRVSRGYELAIPRRGIFKLQRDMTVSTPWVAYTLRYCSYKERDGSYRRGAGHSGCDLGMPGPSAQNWYSSGFMDVELDGHSLDATHAEWAKVKTEDGRAALEGTWKTPRGTVRIVLTVARDKGLEIIGRLGDDVTAKKVVVPLLAYPATYQVPDKARRLVTAKRTVKAPAKCDLDRVSENVVVLYDANYDVPHPKASGPCALRFEPGKPRHARVDLGTYGVRINLNYSGARSFRVFLYDYAGCTNAEVLAYYREKVFPAR